MSKEIFFDYASGAESLEDQAFEYGLKLRALKHFEHIRKAINLLFINDYLKQSDVRNCFKKLHERVMNNLEEIE